MLTSLEMTTAGAAADAGFRHGSLEIFDLDYRTPETDAGQTVTAAAGGPPARTHVQQISGSTCWVQSCALCCVSSAWQTGC